MPRIQQNALGAPMGTAPVMPTQGGNPYAGQGMQALGRGLTAVADVTQEYALRLREARQRRDIARFKVDSARAFMDLAEQYRGDQDFETAPQRWEADAMARRDELMQGITDPETREAAGFEFDGLGIRFKAQFSDDLFKREKAYTVAGFEGDLDFYVNQAVMAPDDATRARAETDFTEALDGLGRWIDPADAVRYRTGFDNRVAFERARRQVEASGHFEPQAVAGVLSPEQIKGLEDMAKGREEDALRWADQLASRLEKELHKRQEDAAIEAFAGVLDGSYSLADLRRDSRARRFSLADARSLRRMLSETGTGQSDPLARLGIMEGMTAGLDQRRAIMQAVEHGELTPGDAAGLLEKNRSIQRQEGPLASREYQEAEGLLARVFAQGGDRFDYTRQDRYALAADELMQTVQAQGPEAAIPTARMVLARELERGLARPAGYVGEMTARDLEAYRDRLTQDMAALSPEERQAQFARFDGIMRQIEAALGTIARIQDIRTTGGMQ